MGISIIPVANENGIMVHIWELIGFVVAAIITGVCMAWFSSIRSDYKKKMKKNSDMNNGKRKTLNRIMEKLENAMNPSAWKIGIFLLFAGYAFFDILWFSDYATHVVKLVAPDSCFGKVPYTCWGLYDFFTYISTSTLNNILSNYLLPLYVGFVLIVSIAIPSIQMRLWGSRKQSTMYLAVASWIVYLLSAILFVVLGFVYLGHSGITAGGYILWGGVFIPLEIALLYGALIIIPIFFYEWHRFQVIMVVMIIIAWIVAFNPLVSFGSAFHLYMLGFAFVCCVHNIYVCVVANRLSSKIKSTRGSNL